MKKTWWEKLKEWFDRRPPYCKQCGREETRPEWSQKMQCSMCYGRLVPGSERNSR